MEQRPLLVFACVFALLLLVVVASSSPVVDGAAAESTLQRLERQLDELKRQREEDRLQLERVQQQREKDGEALKVAANCHATVHWMREQLESVKREMRELAAAQNVSLALRQEGATEARLRLLSSDLTSTRHEMHKIRAAQEEHQERLAEAESETKELRHTQVEPIRLQMERLQQELLSLSTHTSAPELHQRQRWGDGGKEDNHLSVESDQDLWWKGTSSPRRFRHQGAVRALKQQLRILALNQSALVASLSQWQQQVEAQQNSSLFHLDKKIASLDASLKNASAWAAGVAQVRSTTVKLFQALAGVQDEGGRRAGALQKELAQLEDDLEQMEAAGVAARSHLRADVDHVRLQEGHQLHASSSNRQPAHQQQRLLLHELRLAELEEHVMRLHTSVQLLRNETARLPTDCEGVSTSGPVLLRPDPSDPTTVIRAYCDIDSDGVSWTVVQERNDRDSDDFNRDWSSYKRGFGDVAKGNWWTGNDALHALTGRTNVPYTLRIQLWDVDGGYRVADYGRVKVDDESSGYRLHVGGYQGNASDALRFHDKREFSTRDRGATSEECAKQYEGGWWYRGCQHANLNGRGPMGLTWYDERQQKWVQVTKARMKVRRKENTDTPPPPT